MDESTGSHTARTARTLRAAASRGLVEDPLVLVTVFGPFPGQPHNPTEAVADGFAGEDHVVSHVLDVSFRRAVVQLDELVAMVDPAAVVSFGVAAGTAGIRLEQVARNRSGVDRPDVDGEAWTGGALDDGPATLRSRLPLPAIADALVAAGIRVEPSDDAGTYVCNHVFRRLVTHPSLQGRPVGFVHVPDPRIVPGMDAATVVLAGRIIVDAVAAHARGEP